jgi:hypothetical protein
MAAAPPPAGGPVGAPAPPVSATAQATIKTGLTALTKMAVDAGVTVADIGTALTTGTGYALPVAAAAPIAAPAAAAPAHDIEDLKAIAQYAKYAADTAGAAAKSALYAIAKYGPGGADATADTTAIYNLANTTLKQILGDQAATPPVVGYLEQINTAVEAVVAATDIATAQPEVEKARAFALASIAASALVRAYASVTESDPAASQYAAITAATRQPGLANPPTAIELNQNAIFYLRRAEERVGEIDPTVTPLTIPGFENSMLKARAATVGVRAYVDAGYKATTAGPQDINAGLKTNITTALGAPLGSAGLEDLIYNVEKDTIAIQFGGRRNRRRRTQKNRSRKH